MQSLVIISYYVAIVCLLLELLSLIMHQNCLLGGVGFNVQNMTQSGDRPLCSLTSSSHFTWKTVLGKAVNSPAVAIEAQPEMRVLVRLLA